MSPSPKVIIIKGVITNCNGGDKELGHPLVYLNVKPQGYVVCPYCNQKFISEDYKDDSMFFSDKERERLTS